MEILPGKYLMNSSAEALEDKFEESVISISTLLNEFALEKSTLESCE